MSAKKLDRKNRWRSVNVSFRMSPEEAKTLNDYVRLSGLTKQDYLIRRVLHKEVTVVGSSRVLKAVRDQLAETLNELKRVEAGQGVDEDLMDVIRMMSTILAGMHSES